MICQYCGHKLTDGKCLNPACRGTLIVHKFNLPDGKLVEIADERVWIYDGPFDYLTIDEIDVIHAEIHRNDPDLAEGENLSGDVSVPVEKLEAGRYQMMIPVEISTTGGLLLDRRDGLHGYSLEDYPNARFFKGWAGAPNRKAGE